MEFPWASIITAGVTLLLGGLGAWTAYVVFRTRTVVGLKTVGEQVADTNRRVSDLAAGVIQAEKRHDEFRDHVTSHYVEKNEIADLRTSIDKSIDRMQNSLELATATMGDVRDQVIALTATSGKSSVPPARRRPPKS